MHHEMKISFDELMEILEEELPVYGDFLKFFKIDLGLLPISKGTPLSRIGSLYSQLKDMHHGMLSAYTMMAMLKNGFVDLHVVESKKEDGMREEAFASAKDATREFIGDSIMGGFFHPIVLDNIFVNSENPKEAIHVIDVCAEIPSYRPTVLYFLDTHERLQTKETRDVWLYKCSVDDLIEKLDKNKDTIVLDFPSVERISDFIIIDPLLFRACKEEINSLKQEMEDKIGKNILYHPSGFLSMLAIDRTDFEVEWSNHREKALDVLKKEYEFLVLYEEKEVIHEAQEDMRKAKIYIETEKYDAAVWKAGTACEGMLRVLYHTYKKKTAGEKPSFDFMLNKLRDEIFDDFEEDVFNDLDYIKKWRNAADHPNPQIKPGVAVKVIRKAQLFQELFFRKMKGRL